MSAEPSSTAGPAELVAAFVSVISIAGSALAIFWHPMRVIPFTVLLALIAVGMSPRGARLPLAAVVVGALCFIVGMTIAVTTNNPVY